MAHLIVTQETKKEQELEILGIKISKIKNATPKGILRVIPSVFKADIEENIIYLYDNGDSVAVVEF